MSRGEAWAEGEGARLEAVPLSKKARLTEAIGRTSLVFAMWQGLLASYDIPCEDAHYAAEGVPSGVNITISTYNLQRGERGLEGLAEELAEHPSDIRCLQEAPEADIAAIQDITGLDYSAASWNGQNKRTAYGNVTLTDLDIIYSQSYDLPAAEGHHPRTLLVTVLDHEGTPIVVANTHLAAQNGTIDGRPGLSERQVQANSVWTILHQEPYLGMPQLICGDFNEGRSGKSLGLFAESYADISRALVGRRVATYPTYGAEIDYIFANRAWLPAALRVGGQTSSGLNAADHCRLSADWVRILDELPMPNQNPNFRLQ